MGMYCEYDLFGVETSHYQLWREADMPSDAERIRRIRALVEAGYGDKILIAHDIHTKHRLVHGDLLSSSQREIGVTILLSCHSERGTRLRFRHNYVEELRLFNFIIWITMI